MLIGMSPRAQQQTQEPTQPTQWPPLGWITKKLAADRLDLSESRVAALLTPSGAGFMEGRIRGNPGRSPKSKQKVVLLHEGDVEKLLIERKTPIPIKKKKPYRDPITDVILRRAELLAAPETTPGKPWITVSEAAEYSGLPASVISKLAESGELPALDCGPRPGGKWRIKRTDLDRFEGRRQASRGLGRTWL